MFPNPVPHILTFNDLVKRVYDSVKLYENGGKFSKMRENTVGEREIARFQKTCTVDT